MAEQACAEQLKRGRSTAEVDEGGEVEEVEGQVGEGEVREVDADLCGRPTGAVFKSYVPEGMRQQKPEKKKQKKSRSPRNSSSGADFTAQQRYRKSSPARVGTPTAISRDQS